MRILFVTASVALLAGLASAGAAECNKGLLWPFMRSAGECLTQTEKSQGMTGIFGGSEPQGRAFPAQNPRGATDNVDWRLRAARGYSVGHESQAKTDRVFIRDFVVKANIGAYSHERGIEQRLRFNVDVDVRRPDLKSGDMREVFSYDTIRDAITLMLARGHVELVEKLAEDIADQVLRDARVLGVTIRIEKLDIVPGAVGVEIRRERPKQSAEVHQLFAGLAETGKPG